MARGGGVEPNLRFAKHLYVCSASVIYQVLELVGYTKLVCIPCEYSIPTSRYPIITGSRARHASTSPLPTLHTHDEDNLQI